jgi:DNA mismatch repair protein MutS2
MCDRQAVCGCGCVCRRRFPPPPDTWWGILMVGMRQLRGFGGCNDLIFR